MLSKLLITVPVSAESSFQNFFQFGTIIELGQKFCIYNINAPGQEMDAVPLPEDYVYPTMDQLAGIVADVVEHFGFKSLMGMGVGAGANVMLRYAVRLGRIKRGYDRALVRPSQTPV